ncbi:hypothetical protein IAI18_04370 [Acetobacteraceae bacterium H6797]|nr:hypothetical protein [Acetobacteraceae bacterium H6797]
MTSIGSALGLSPLPTRDSKAKQAEDGGGFAAELAQVAEAPNSGGSTRLEGLLSGLDALKSQQVGMSNRDYTVANLSLKEKIASERLANGEQLDTINVGYEGETYRLAGQMMSLAGLSASAYASVTPSATASGIKLDI